MELWRITILAKFGKKSRQKWSSAAFDFQLVDLGIKPTCLFDLWAVSSKDMQNFTQDLHQKGLTHRKINVLSIGQDVIIYSTNCGKQLLADSSKNRFFIDASSSLLNPSIVDDEKVCYTTHTFTELCDTMNDICNNQITMNDSCDSQVTANDICNYQDLTCVHNVQVNEKLNVPCLFGLLLGYPCVYWYDVTKGDEHCLSGQVLHLYKVKGQLKAHNVKDAAPQASSNEKLQKSECLKNNSTNQKWIAAKTYPSDTFHVIFSFTVPDRLLTSVQDHVESWFHKWKNSTVWSNLFCDVRLEEDTVNPQCVCL